MTKNFATLHQLLVRQSAIIAVFEAKDQPNLFSSRQSIYNPSKAFIKSPKKHYLREHIFLLYRLQKAQLLLSPIFF